MSRFLVFLLGVALFFGGPALVYRYYLLDSVREVTVTVVTLPDRSMQYDASGNKNDSANLVFTDKGTFENTDSWFLSKSDSGGLYAGLFEGGTFTCEVAGWRLAVIGKYPNLIRCE